MAISLREYVETTQRIELRPMQVDLCEHLERAFWNRDAGGEQAEIPVDPQVGSSLIASICYPGWIFGNDPTHRVRLVTYDAYHSMRFSRCIKHLIKSDSHTKCFPDSNGTVASPAQHGEWRTVGRLLSKAPDQPSFVAIGIASGMVGLGVDTLIVDDLFKHVAAALSAQARATARVFWVSSVKPRLTEKSNVFVFLNTFNPAAPVVWSLVGETVNA